MVLGLSWGFFAQTVRSRSKARKAAVKPVPARKPVSKPKPNALGAIAYKTVGGKITKVLFQTRSMSRKKNRVLVAKVVRIVPDGNVTKVFLRRGVRGPIFTRVLREVLAA